MKTIYIQNTTLLYKDVVSENNGQLLATGNTVS